MIVRFDFVNLKMQLCNFIFLSLLLMITDGFTVKGPSGPLVVPLGASVLLPCSVDTPLPMKDLEVQWRRSDSETLVHLYQDRDIRPEAQEQEYHDRAHFFTEDIKHGNFSLLLENVRAEDEGEYTCKVYSGHDSAETVVKIKDVERLIVSGSNGSISAYVREDVTLSCSVDSHIPPEEIEELSWKKTDKDGDLLVLLYQNNEALPEASDEQYRDRVEFFTDEIHRGNFSLRLKSVRTEDKGLYMCQVFAGELSANTTVVLEQLGFSALHIMVLILCITACGSAVIICCLIYCRSNNTDTSRTVLPALKVSLVICPNICMFIAFIIWGVTEGFLKETITCCALYVLRPVMLFWAVPYLSDLQDSTKPWMRFSTITSEFAVLTVIVYSVLFTYAWKQIAHYLEMVVPIAIGICFGLVLLSSLCIFFCGVTEQRRQEARWDRERTTSRDSNSGRPSAAQEAIVSERQNTRIQEYKNKRIQKYKIRSLIFLIPVQAFFLLFSLTVPSPDFMDLTCVAFINVLSILVIFEDRGRVRLHNAFVFVFGAVGVILLNSVTLMAELILKRRNGERAVGDLRVIVFPSECAFVFCWLGFSTYAWYLDKISCTDQGTPQRVCEMERFSSNY